MTLRVLGAGVWVLGAGEVGSWKKEVGNRKWEVDIWNYDPDNWLLIYECYIENGKQSTSKINPTFYSRIDNYTSRTDFLVCLKVTLYSITDFLVCLNATLYS